MQPSPSIPTESDRPSKSRVKRDMHALLDLGKQLVDLGADQLKRLPLDEKLHSAILLAQRTTSREGRRRQIHYVGKLMRTADAAAIRQQLDIWAHGSRQLTAHMHKLERLREQLLADDAALTALLAQYPAPHSIQRPGTDIARLRTLIRESRKEARANAALLSGQTPQRKHYRALFQALKMLLENAEADTVKSAVKSAAAPAAEESRTEPRFPEAPTTETHEY